MAEKCDSCDSYEFLCATCRWFFERRERIATAIFGHMIVRFVADSAEPAARSSVRWADALMDELDKEPPPGHPAVVLPWPEAS